MRSVVGERNSPTIQLITCYHLNNGSYGKPDIQATRDESPVKNRRVARFARIT